jgi:hypothetical protein
MGRRTGVTVALAGLIAGPQGGALADETLPTERIAVWLGFDASVESQYGYTGATYALSDSIDANGFLVRVGLGGGQYETRGSNSQLVDHYDVDLMAGYHAGFGGPRFRSLSEETSRIIGMMIPRARSAGNGSA